LASLAPDFVKFALSPGGFNRHGAVPTYMHALPRYTSIFSDYLTRGEGANGCVVHLAVKVAYIHTGGRAGELRSEDQIDHDLNFTFLSHPPSENSWDMNARARQGGAVACEAVAGHGQPSASCL
jgi:hypothetical protein